MTNLKDSSTDSTSHAIRELIRSLREGDAKAALLLDQLYRDSLIRFCWGYLGRMEEAEDAVQEICYKVLTADKVPDYFRSWIYKNSDRYPPKYESGGVGVVECCKQLSE